MRAVSVKTDIAKRVQGKLSKTQREYLLRQQMQAIREELGEGESPGEEDDLDQLQAGPGRHIFIRLIFQV